MRRQPQVHGPVKMKRLARVLEIVQRGPVTSRDVAQDLFRRVERDTVAKASAYLSELREAGLVRVTGKTSSARTIHGKFVEGRPMNIWSAA